MTSSSTTKPTGGRWTRFFMRFVFGVLLPLALLAGAGLAARTLLETSPKAHRQAPAREAKLVETGLVSMTSRRTTVEAMGAVAAARTVDIQPRVGGQIIALSDELAPGGIFTAGDVIVTLDPTDYELIVRQRSADLSKAQADVAVEQGAQAIARRECELLGETMNEAERALMLRTPQLAMVTSAKEKAEALLARAELDLARTVVRAPINAVVDGYDAELGEQVSSAMTLARLTGTDQYWVQVSMPVDQLKWIHIPRLADEAGSTVRVFNDAAWGEDVWREGRVLRLADRVEEDGRMARLIVAVDDPLALTDAHAGAPKLLIGSYVRVEIDGIELSPVAALPRSLVRDGDRVWIMNGEDQLEIRAVTVAFLGRDEALITDGLAEGERIVVTDLSAPVAGMPLRLEGEAAPERPERNGPGTGGRMGGGGGAGGGRSQ